jgi:hypothetical protein
MKVAKKIFIGSLILLLATTPLIATAGINESKQSLSMNDETGFLGTVTIRHQPMLVAESKGMEVVSYEPPEDNPNFIYNFTELENGSVRLNFTVTIKHFLNKPGMPYFASWLFPNNFRFTWVKYFWIHEPGKPYDIYTIENQKPCTSTNVETYNIPATGKYLETNGENVTLHFWLWGYPGVTPIRFIYTIISLRPGGGENFLSPYCDPLNYIEITIHPV